MNFKKTFLSIIIITCLTACEKSLPASTPLTSIITPESHLATSTIESTATTVEVETKMGVFHALTVKGWVLYWDAKYDLVSSFAFGQNDSVWIGENGGVIRKLINLNLSSGSYTEYVLEQAYDITTIKIDKQGTLWIGNPVYRFEDESWTFLGSNYLYPQISPDNSIWGIFLNNSLPDCPARYDHNKWTLFCPPYKDNKTLIRQFFVDNMGNMWLSTEKDDYGQGVWMLNSTVWQLMDEVDSDKKLPYVMAQGPTGNLWFVSSRTKLWQKENGRIKQFDEKKWILDIENPADLVGMVLGNEFQVDRNNVLWTYGRDDTDEYILRLNNNQWEKFLSGDELNIIWGTSVDIYSFGFNPSGNLCLGTNLGFMCKTK
jgi:hypothetical protein